MATADSPQTQAHGAGHGLLLALLLSQFAFGLLAMTLCDPSMWAWGMRFGVNQPTVQLSFSAFVLAFGGFQLV